MSGTSLSPPHSLGKNWSLYSLLVTLYHNIYPLIFHMLNICLAPTRLSAMESKGSYSSLIPQRCPLICQVNQKILNEIVRKYFVNSKVSYQRIWQIKIKKAKNMNLWNRNWWLKPERWKLLEKTTKIEKEKWQKCSLSWLGGHMVCIKCQSYRFPLCKLYCNHAIKKDSHLFFFFQTKILCCLIYKAR